MRLARPLALALGFTLGFVASYAPGVWASRNSAGTHALPSGNPVVSGTTITSANENAFRSDVSSELTNSLDRNGRGAMLAPLQCSNGTVAAPSLTFGSDTDTGLYRAGANNPAMSVGGTKMQEWTTTTAAVFTGVGAGNGITATGGATGRGVYGTGGGTGYGGVYGVGGTDGIGVEGYGTGTGQGVWGEGGATGVGVRGKGGATSGSGCYCGATAGNSKGLEGYGSGTQPGVYGLGGGTDGDGVKGTGGTTNGNGGVFDGAGTGSGIVVGTGYALFNGTNPAATTAFTNKVTSTNIVKAWGRVTTNGAGSATLALGFNVASVSVEATGEIRVNLASAFTGTNNYVVLPSLVNASTAALTAQTSHVDADTFLLFNFDGFTIYQCDTLQCTATFVVLGLQ